MNLYFQQMHEIYASESHTYKNNMLRNFSTCMEAIQFFSVNPKFEVEIPIDRSKLSSKNPHSLMTSLNKECVSDDMVIIEGTAQMFLL